MSSLDTTNGSTHATDDAVKLYLPPEHATCVLAYLDRYQAQQPELERLHAEVQRLTPDPAHARQCRTTELELPISNAIESIRARLEAMHQTFRISAVLDHLWIKRDLYGITKLPTRAVVQRVLVKHGLYVIA